MVLQESRNTGKSIYCRDSWGKIKEIANKIAYVPLTSCMGKQYIPSHKAMDIIVTIIYFNIVSQASWVIFKVKVQETQVNTLTILESNVPVADLVIIILIWETWRFKNSPWICEDTTTFFC